jgi:hypothetical protein
MSEHLPVDEVTVSRADVLRTRVTLARLQGRQERLRDGLNRSGLTSIADRLDWLHAQKSPDEALAWRRKWRDLGLAEAHEPVEAFARPESLSVPKRRKKPAPVIPRARQLEIALAVMAAKEAREGGMEKAA